MSVETITLGCRLNFAESETIARSAPADEDWIVVNSCAVTNEAVRQTRQAIRRAHRQRPDAKILVTGCAAELEPATFAAMPGVSRVVGNASKLNSFAANDVMAPVPAGLLANVKSFVAVQTGCDHRCTFCSIWQARGPSVSLPFEAIRDAVAREIDRGAKEIVLTGVDITDYRRRALGKLCQRLLAAEPRLAAPAPVVARQHRDRRRPVRADRRRAAADAALPSVAAGRRRHDPEADEAPPQPRRCGAHRRADQGRSRRTRPSAPTSSPAFLPKLKRWRSTPCNCWTIATSLPLTSSPSRRGPTRPPHACRSCRARW